MDIMACKAILFLGVPIVGWLIIGATVAYIGKARESKKKEEELTFEEKSHDSEKKHNRYKI